MMKPSSLLREAISRIRIRPGVYLRQRSLREFETYIHGFCLGLNLALPPEFPIGGRFGRFRDWLQAKYPEVAANFHPVQVEWLDLVLAIENGDDQAAFDRFFLLWEGYLQSEDA